MTTIDLTRSQFLMPLLQKMMTGLTQLSNSDSALNQKIYELHHFLAEPHQVDGNALLSIVDSAKDLASSYEFKKEKIPGNFVSALPGIFFAARTELEHMIKSKQLMEEPKSTIARLEIDIERFYKLATEST